MDGAAAVILKRAVTLDGERRYIAAMECYQEGIQLLIDSLKGFDGEKKQKIRSKIEEYMGRVKQLKKTTEEQKAKGVFHEQLSIKKDEWGYSYESVLGPFLNIEVVHVKVEDPYIRIYHQLTNFLRFCEMLIKKCKSLHRIHLLTTQDSKLGKEQKQGFDLIKKSLSEFNISLEVEYSSTLHDRQIILSNGWIVKIGRGLDYFKPAEKLTLGYFDLDLRKCHETTVDIFHSKDVIHKTR